MKTLSKTELGRLVGLFDTLVRIDQHQKNIKRSVKAVGQLEDDEAPNDRHNKT